MSIFKNDREHLSQEDIKRYLDGEMSGEDMHHFEHHLLTCEFCDEAFQGYQLTQSSLSDDTFKRLRGQLDERVNRKKYPWLTIAASVVILVCASLTFMFFFLEENVDSVAMVEKKEVEERDVEEVPETTASNAKSEEEQANEPKPVIQESVVEEKPDQALKKKELKPKEEVTVLSESSESEGFFEEEEKASGFGAGDEEVVEVLADQEIIVDEQPEEEVVIFDDAFDLASTDQSTAENDKQLNATGAIVRNKSVISGRSAARQRIIAPSPQVKEERETLPQNAVPVVGFDSYKLYLKNSLKYPESAKSAGVEGEVKLTFSINKKGRIKDMTVVEGLSEECDLEAKRLVLEGPKWTLVDKNLPDENNVVNLIIEFDLNQQE